MLTRIEINGFKTFEDFTLDLAPLLVVLGPNAVGKSNLFDAIRLLSRLAETDLATAFKEMRGQPHELFRTQPDGTIASKMSFAVEVLVDPVVRSGWGEEKKLTQTRIRYELVIERKKIEGGREKIFVVEEKAAPIRASEDRLKKGRQNPSKSFRRSHLKYARVSSFLETVDDAGKPTFEIHQDQSQGRKRPATAAERTVLSSITSIEFAHLFALGEEMRSWKLVQLDPSSLRRPSPMNAPDTLLPDGSNIAAVLARIEGENQGSLAEIARDLAEVIPGVASLRVFDDPANHEYQMELIARHGPIHARVASDGTLRALALLTLLHDPRHRGLICFEEPENGIHPARLKSLIQILKSLLTSFEDECDEDPEPLSQMLLASHSPVVLSALQDENAIVFADVTTIVDPSSGTMRPRTRMRLLPDGLFVDDPERYVTRREAQAYLETVGKGDPA
ncbi:MAG: AAA family ATPase [Alphaproteobacteria bacterium]|nr:AAA family ATPase [Alphaproteobacteria bacterium]